MVLAAGLGRRLAGVTSKPKWLLPVDGSCPAAVQLAGMERAGVERVHVVVSPEPTDIDDFLAPWRERLDLDLVVNEQAPRWNNWYSLLLGLEAWGSRSGDDVAVINSDLYANEAWFATLLARIRACEQSAALAVDRTRGHSDEAMKVGLDAAGTRVADIGKVGVEQPGGEYVGIAWWSRKAAAELEAVLRGFMSDPSRSDNWYEHGIQRHLRLGSHYAVVDVPDERWVEIDDERDLEAAFRLSASRSPLG